MIVFCISMHIHCMSTHSMVCTPIILSVCPSFCPSVYPSVHPYDCSHIVKIAKSIAKSSKWYVSSMKWKKYWKENCIEKPHRCSYKLAEVFFITFELWLRPLGWWMCGFSSLDVVEIRWSCRLSLGKSLGLLQHDFIHFSKVLSKICLFLENFLLFCYSGSVRHSLPGFGWD